jgi:hypothetical protein
MASQWLSGLANASTNASNSSRYPRASHDSFHPGDLDENRTPPSMRRTANRRAMPSTDASPDRSSNSFRSGNERLYEAYNDLHTLAQDFEKPFDAPAILVVGHQTDGKSGMCLVNYILRWIVSCCYMIVASPAGHLHGTSHTAYMYMCQSVARITTMPVCTPACGHVSNANNCC